MSHYRQFAVENIHGFFCGTEVATSEQEALKSAKARGISGAIVFPYYLNNEHREKHLSHLAHLDRKIAMKPLIDFSLLGSVH